MGRAAGGRTSGVKVFSKTYKGVPKHAKALKRWKEYFEKLMNEENNRDPRTEEPEVVNEEVNCVSREEVKNAMHIRSFSWSLVERFHLLT